MSLSVLIFFAILFGLVFMLRAARIGTVVAFLFAGVLSGPFVLNLFQLTDTWTFLGDLGIIFLWFNIGLQINMKRLWQMKRTIFGFGAAQVMMVAVMLFPILHTITSWTIMGTIMVALLLAMSSTSEDLQLLADRDELNTNMGHQTFSILLFQDLLSIPLLAMLPVFAGRSFNLGATAIDILVLSIGLILGVVVVGRLILNPLLRMVAKLKSKEAFLLVIMLTIAVWAVAMGALGLPAGLGAFLAGMLMSETIYRHQISAEISPYSMLFLALFFVSLGMGLNLSFLMERWYWILIGLGGLIAIKFLAIFIVARVRGVPDYDATKIALILAQGGEFGLLMLQTMKQGGITAIPAPHEEILAAIIILSIIMTPLLLAVYDFLQRRGKLFPQRHPRKITEMQSDVVPQVIICGFGRVGQIVAKMLVAQKIPYVALDLSVNAVMVGREAGYNVVYGNSTNADVLRSFGLVPKKTRAVVVALDNATTARETVLTIKSIAPRVKIFARARNLADSKLLLKEGVAEALPETMESSFSLGYGLLEHLGVSDARIDALLADMRANNYEKLNTISEAR
ncbi:MAG: cation:proton antiporter [Alphaproteobacteria bacterium]|nr:cation:proton antiporter [Alphaproteobacteria bacterium]